MGMKKVLVAVLMFGGMASAVQAQTAQEMESAAPKTLPGETQEQHGKRLLAEMLKALGGDAWLNKQTSVIEGQTASFFRGAPTGSVIRFVHDKRFAAATVPEATRV